MKFSESLARSMVNAVGAPGTVDGQLIMVVPADSYMAELSGMGMDANDKQVTICEADIALLALSEGDGGSLLVLDGMSYRVLNIDPSEDGFASLTLGAV